MRPRDPSPRLESKPLTNDDVLRLFSGAPEFHVAGSQHCPRPRVAFRGEITGGPENARDYLDFEHSTFTVMSLSSHRVTETSTTVLTQDGESPLADSHDDLLEIPGMASLAGRDPGTVGLEYFLQMPVSDSKLTEAETDTPSNRAMLLLEPETLGLRQFNMEIMIDRLSEISDTRQSNSAMQQASSPSNEQKAAEMYADLFSKLLATPKFAPSSEEDPTGFDVQITTLANILNTPGLWYDFSYVEWRIRLGQLLWSVDDNQPSPKEELRALSERDVVLLQITLASELLIRLELSSGARVAAAQSRKVQWDLVLARQFLDNVRVTAKAPNGEEKQNRSSVFSMMSFYSAKESFEISQIEPILYPRHELRQLEGLLKFAETLQWPHVEEVEMHMKDRHQSTRTQADYSAYATPIATPSLLSNSQGGYFGSEKRPQVARAATAQSVQLLPASAYGSDFFDAGGWLSRSWLTGLVLPGEVASHFLISTLLENSPKAIEALGDSANLYGGFLYQSRSFWSKSCVVGRVLAAAEEARDCMGWISGPGTPSKQTDGWVNIEVKDLPTTIPRITADDALAHNSSFLKGKEPFTLTEADFEWPTDSPPVMGNEVIYHGLTLESINTSSEASHSSSSTSEDLQNNNSSLAPSTACLTFGSKATSNPIKTTIPLLHDITFISSYPCFPDPRSPRPSPPPSPFSDDDGDKQLPDPPCHPLHTGYGVEIIPAASLLADSSSKLEQSGGCETLVLDCRGSNELDLLARAWCAKVGENAVVGRAGRTCLACCVREASGLGVKVVIRT